MITHLACQSHSTTNAFCLGSSKKTSNATIWKLNGKMYTQNSYLKAICASLTISGICVCSIFSSIISSFPFVHLSIKGLENRPYNIWTKICYYQQIIITGAGASYMRLEFVPWFCLCSDRLFVFQVLWFSLPTKNQPLV